ncbi:fimbrial protein [Salinisphaera sp. Q1T1-3]|uniref:fimbrial protein n=1 Tax=Salinisphaera sp. Q1T1-3 TaxID=2321229 RepID=UPI000E70AA49|nr:fimbrial protein [Salinisphaera sp. Q1T1-3]RJS91619.1 type 1 fimbrial protein [Salinisphaera sp. Q1T1-3]
MFSGRDATLSVAGSVAGFNGVGSVRGQQAFAIRLACNGAADARDAVALVLDYEPAESLSARGVLANRAGDDAAAGVGIQILDDRGQPAPPGRDIDTRALPLGERRLRFSFSARYYQTRATVTAGRVRGLANFTIDYP